MGEFDVGSFMKDVVSGLATLTESVKVIGEPVNIEGKVIIPAVVARVGFGAGGGSGTSPSREGDAEQGTGGGGGGAAVMTPVFLVVDEDGERLLTVPGPLGKVGSVVDSAKSALDRVMPRKKAPDCEEIFEDLEDEEPGEGPAH